MTESHYLKMSNVIKSGPEKQKGVSQICVIFDIVNNFS
jgi:hypothetical protein